MKILHCCLSCFYIDNYNYQENILPHQNKLDGHDVMILASTETYINNKSFGYVDSSEYYSENDILVKRIPYRYFPIEFISRKARSYLGVSKIIASFAPDVILFHGLCAYEIITVAKYKQAHPEVKLYMDSHEDFHNSAQNFLSKYVLHKIFYKHILKKTLPYIDKIFYVSYECKQFLINIYDIPEYMLEYYPLGGIIVDDNSRKIKREQIRSLHSISRSDILLVHSGKMGQLKKTLELVKALHETNAQNLKLLIIGSMTHDVSDNVMPLIEKDPRITYLGWKSGDELIDYLCASDLYVQPGSQSATMQNALCCGSAAALFPHESHKYLLGDSVFYIETIDDMKKLFELITDNPNLIEEKRMQSNKIAREKLDYKVLAARLYK